LAATLKNALFTPNWFEKAHIFCAFSYVVILGLKLILSIKNKLLLS
jgi:hypothetical protein